MSLANFTFKRFISIICLSSLFAVTAIPTAGNAIDTTDSQIMVWAPIVWPKVQAFGNQGWCVDGLEGLLDGKCGQATFGSLTNNMSPCAVDSSVSCIKKIEFQLTDGLWQKATYLGPMSPSYSNWSSFPEIDLGPSSHASLYTTTNLSGEKVVWMVVIGYTFTASEIKSGTTGPSEFGISIFPVRHISASECSWQTTWEQLLLIAGAVMNFKDYCYERLKQPSIYSARLLLTLKNEPRGWVTSYLQNFNATVTKSISGSSGFDLMVEGSNVIFPVASFEIAKDDLTRQEKLCSVDTEFSNYCNGKFPWKSATFFHTIGSRQTRSKAKYLSFLEQFPELDQAKFDSRTWSMWINMKNEEKINSCSAPKGIYGVVGGNAMVIDDSIPIWNASTQTLEFGVASPHYKSDGQVARGFYEMQLNEQVAKCLWGTKVTPANVSLSVLDENGDSKVATAAISVKNGMVIFRATGFTYSSTKLSVSLKKLVCVKNGLTKTQPKGKTTCPKGWKKKQ